MKKYFLLLALILFIGSAFPQPIPNMPVSSGAGAAVVWGDSIYYFGGANDWDDFIPYLKIRKFDGISWSVEGTIPDDKTFGAAAVLVGNEVFLLGGYPGGESYNRKYNLVTKQWTTLTSSANTQDYGITAQYVNGNIYLFDPNADKCFAYNIASNSWEEKLAGVSGGNNGLSSVVYKDEIYITGFGASEFWKYTPATNTMTYLDNLPYEPIGASMGLVKNLYGGIKDSIYCFGGWWGWGGNAEFDRVLMYEISTQKWKDTTLCAQTSSKRCYMAAAEYRGGLYSIGGLNENGQAVNTVEQIIPQSFVSTKVAYIWNTDSSKAVDFRDFLTGQGYPTTLINISDIPVANFYDYGLIMIDGESGAGSGKWGTPNSVQNLMDLNRPIIALGYGGASFYQQAGLSINCDNCWTEEDHSCNSSRCTGIFVEDSTFRIYNSPNKIDFFKESLFPIVKLYNTSSFLAEYKPNLANTVSFVGRDPGNADHYSIVNDQLKYTLWGFGNSPSDMTDAGKNLFLNFVYSQVGQGTVGVDDENVSTPSSFRLNQNYPNPFNPVTTITWTSSVGSWQTLKVYDILGREVATLVNEYKPAGSYKVEFNGSDLTSGVYFYRIQTEKYSETRKMVLMK